MAAKIIKLMKPHKHTNVTKSPEPPEPQVPALKVVTDWGTYCQIYAKMVAFIPLDSTNGTSVLIDREMWDTSNGSNESIYFKYISGLRVFLRETLESIRSKVGTGEYVLTNLNR